MIIPVEFLWAQLDGPQISAIMEALVDYLKDMFDNKGFSILDYINNISVTTANDSHLSLLGALAGFVRPNITEADKNYFFFTDSPQYPVDHGFADPNDKVSGGKFADLFTGQGADHVPLNREHYRALLKAFTLGESQGELGSLALLDDICYELSKLDIPGVAPFYKFSFQKEVTSTRGPGDVFLDMGQMNDWNNPLHIYAVLNGLADTVYSPVPRLFISIDVSPADTETTN